jgi:hypothetical protein
MEYLLLSATAAVIAGVFLFVRHRKPYSDQSFDPTIAVEPWDDPDDCFPDTVLMDTRQIHH